MLWISLEILVALLLLVGIVFFTLRGTNHRDED